MDSLPTELLTHIFCFLNVSDRKEAALTCHRWYEATLDPILLKDTFVELSTSSSHCLPATHLRYRRNPNVILKDVSVLTNGALGQSSYRELCQNLQSLSLRGTDVTERTFTNITIHCINLESLDLSGCNSLFMSGQLLSKEEDQERLKVVLHKVKELSLGSIRYLSDATFKRVVSVCDGIEKLSLSSCKALFHSSGYIADPHDYIASTAVLTFKTILSFIQDRAKMLKSLDFSRTSINDEALHNIGGIAGLCLKEFIIHSCHEVTDDGIWKLCSKQKKLERLDITQCVGLTNSTLHAIVANLSDLKSLNTTKCRQIDDKAVEKLHKLNKLESLQMASCYVLSSEGLTVGLCDGTMTRLTELNLSCCNLVGDSFVVELARTARNMTHLDLSSCFGISDISLHHVAKNMKYLRLLKLSWCKRITDYGLLGLLPEGYIPHEECEGMCKCTRKSTIEPGNFGKLTEIRLPEPEYPKLNIDDIDYLMSSARQEYAIANLGVLRDLDLRSCHQITDVGIIKGIRFRELRSLHLPHNVSDDSLRALSTNLPSLEQLYVPQCKRITDTGVIYIARKCYRLTALDISAIDNITDKSIEALATYSHRLKFIDISLCRNIRPVCVDMMERTLPNLRTIQRRHVGGSLDVY